jgi:hypothetical protein
MATSPSPYPTEPKSLVLNRFEQKWLKLRMQDAVARSWAEACSISERLFREPSPPDDLWERAIQRTASALLGRWHVTGELRADISSNRIAVHALQFSPHLRRVTFRCYADMIFHG